MKKLIALFAIILFSSAAFAQKFAYVDTKFILENIPEYTKAQKTLDDLSADWQKDIEKKYKDIDDLYKAYQNEQVLLTDDMKKKREKEITDKEKEVKDLQKQKFGFEGELFKKRQELVKPIQDKIYEAIQKLASAKGYDFVFDKSVGGSPILYCNPALDKSSDILKDMGYSVGKKAAAPNTTTDSDSGTKPTPKTTKEEKR